MCNTPVLSASVARRRSFGVFLTPDLDGYGYQVRTAPTATLQRALMIVIPNLLSVSKKILTTLITEKGVFRRLKPWIRCRLGGILPLRIRLFWW